MTASVWPMIAGFSLWVIVLGAAAAFDRRGDHGRARLFQKLGVVVLGLTVVAIVAVVVLRA